MTSASSSSTSATRCLSSAGSTRLSSDRFVKAIDSVASITAPAQASPKESPNEPDAEFTPAPSLARSSEIGDSV